MSQILVIDAKAIFREPIAEALRGRGFEAICAANGTDALRIVDEQPIDLIVLDLVLPELDGLTFLRMLRQRPQYSSLPVIVLTAISARTAVIEAVRLGVHDYMLKGDFSLAELYERVARKLHEKNNPPARPTAKAKSLESQKRTAASARSAPSMANTTTATATATATATKAPVQIVSESKHKTRAVMELKTEMTRDELLTVVQRGLELRPLASAVQKLMSIMASSNCSVDDVAKCISQDQALSIRILRLANGALYSRGKTVESLKDAVSRIGLQEVRDVAMTLAVLQEYEGKSAQFLDPHLFWEHSIACGVLAHEISRACGWKEGDFFLFGMLHDVGRLVLVEHVPDRYENVCTKSKELDVPLETIESKLLLVDHCEVLQKSLEYWKFPQEFITPLTNHHTSAERIQRLGPRNAQAAWMITLADRLAHALVLGDSGNRAIYPYESIVEQLGLAPDTLRDIIAKTPDQTNSLRLSMLSRSHDGEWPDFRKRIRHTLPDGLSALYCGLDEPLDAFQLFFERLAISNNGREPQLGIIYEPDARRLGHAIERFNQLETKDASQPLPVLIIFAKGKVDTSNAWFSNRSYAVMQTPVRIEPLVKTIHQLLV